ncbi:MAG: hydantoinase/oxoprolinase family protein [Anaerolineales bacterium]
MRLGIDVGGTFTDLVLIDDDTGRIHYTKTLSTPADLAQAVVTGIARVLQQAEVGSEALDYVVHGTTVGTNALIERRGAKVGLITTAGFRDVLEIARIERPDAGLYDMTVDLPDPLVPRYLRLEADERVGADGSVVRELDEISVARAAETFEREGVEAIAVCLLFSFRNPKHERLVQEVLQRLLPGIPVTLSSEIAPEFREYERTSTCVINAYLLPITRSYVERLAAELGREFGISDLRIMQASGGAMTAEVAKSRAVHMVNSGPAGGALASAVFGQLAGEDKIIGVDMGGTSFDVCLIVDDKPRLKSEGEFEDFPVKIPMIDVEGIGAGGGSIAWVDSGGALNVGPRSAGADPGPACYGLGGELPTVTDANLVLGRLNPSYFLGAEMELHVEPAREAVSQHIAEPLGLSTEEAAAGIVRVVNANMVRGISVNSTQKGYDLREFSLLAFGGAGPLHAVELAEDLGMTRVIVPPYCSVFSAFGAVASDVRHDYVQTVAWSESAVEAGTAESAFAALEARAMVLLKEEQVPEERIRLQRSADIRYEGQSYELTIPLRSSGPLEGGDIQQMIVHFHARHQQIYAYSDLKESVEVISLRLAAEGLVPELRLRSSDQIPSGPPTPKSQRPIHFPGSGFLESYVYEREHLVPGHAMLGPCLIEEKTSTTVIPTGWRAHVDPYGNIVVSPHSGQKEADLLSIKVEA